MTQVNASRCSVTVLARVMVVSGMRAGTSHNQNIGGFGFLVDRVHIFLPSGTHLDAPAHFSKGKWRVGIFYYD